jgi:hypothetical protein
LHGGEEAEVKRTARTSKWPRIQSAAHRRAACNRQAKLNRRVEHEILAGGGHERARFGCNGSGPMASHKPRAMESLHHRRQRESFSLFVKKFACHFEQFTLIECVC